MATARIFRSGNSQAVRLPKQFRLASKEVEIIRRGDELVLSGRRSGGSREYSRFSPVCPTTCLSRSLRTSRLDVAKGYDPPRYLLDTNICMYIRRHQPRQVLAMFQKLRPGSPSSRRGLMKSAGSASTLRPRCRRKQSLLRPAGGSRIWSSGRSGPVPYFFAGRGCAIFNFRLYFRKKPVTAK